ncbi:hypothetical protein [Mesorhizobium sp.]|uniref:hypothetical protein n=1 Tax=Mesorhizobium sp. TaxID=1871066 RepID=UPI0025BC83EF|nr:hypothetical protein [Mesorhizobium sp.]
MDATFDDLARALQAPRKEAWGKTRIIALDLLGKLFTGLVIGIGFAIVRAIAG